MVATSVVPTMSRGGGMTVWGCFAVGNFFKIQFVLMSWPQSEEKAANECSEYVGNPSRLLS